MKNNTSGIAPSGISLAVNNISMPQPVSGGAVGIDNMNEADAANASAEGENVLPRPFLHTQVNFNNSSGIIGTYIPQAGPTKKAEQPVPMNNTHWIDKAVFYLTTIGSAIAVITVVSILVESGVSRNSDLLAASEARNQVYFEQMNAKMDSVLKEVQHQSEITDFKLKEQRLRFENEQLKNNK